MVRALYIETFAPLFHIPSGDTIPEPAFLYLKDDLLFAKSKSAEYPDEVDPNASEIVWELTPYASSDALNTLFDGILEIAEKAGAGDERAVKFINDYCSFVEAELDAFTVEEYYGNVSDGEILSKISSEDYVRAGVILTNLDEWKKSHGA